MLAGGNKFGTKSTRPNQIADADGDVGRVSPFLNQSRSYAEIPVPVGSEVVNP